MKSQPPSTSTPSNLAFSASLSSLLATTAATKPKPPSLTRPTASSNPKDNIFTTHNRNSKKRAAADISTDTPPPHQTHTSTSEAVSATTLARSRRKMEEKARLYRAMKRGDYVPDSNGGINHESESLIDFDRKHADAASSVSNPLNGQHNSDSSSDDYGSDDDGTMSETIEYTDELGRTRTGTRAAAAKLARRLAAADYASAELEAASARPGQRPQNLIVGDVIQDAAFNPDAGRERLMEELARKRDRSVTPPEEVRYDATSEVRSKGVGFYQFSRDKEGRERELGALGRERAETERVRGEREMEGVVEGRRRGVEERRRVIEEGRRREADRFLDGLDVGGGGVG